MAKVKEANNKNTKTQTYKNYIGGEWIEISVGRIF